MRGLLSCEGHSLIKGFWSLWEAALGVAATELLGARLGQESSEGPETALPGRLQAKSKPQTSKNSPTSRNPHSNPYASCAYNSLLQ